MDNRQNGNPPDGVSDMSGTPKLKSFWLDGVLAGTFTVGVFLIAPLQDRWWMASLALAATLAGCLAVRLDRGPG